MTGPSSDVQPRIAAVLVNYNAGEELRRAVQSIADEMHDEPWEVVVVDNASADGSADLVEGFGPQVRVLRNTVNVGFGRGVNQGVAATAAPLVLVMNPDCRLVAGAMDGLRAELLRHDRCAMVGPRILDPDGSVQGSARGDPNMLTGIFGRAQALTRLLPWLPAARRNVVTLAGVQGPTEVDWLSGACFLARRHALAEVQGFDERYFLYWEDADLCRRLRGVGYHVRYVPSATAIHRVGLSSQTAKAASIRAFHASALIYYRTHVATGAMDPRRPIAAALLALRRWWRLRKA